MNVAGRLLNFFRIHFRPPLLKWRSWSYVHGASNVPLIANTIGQQFDIAVEKTPEREAFVFVENDIRRTFSQFKDEVDSLATGLLAIGLKSGDRLGIWGPNSLEWLTVQFATSKIGIILVNINPGYRQEELKYALNKVSCTALLAAPTFKTSNYVQMIKGLCPEIEYAKAGNLQAKSLPNLRHLIFMGKDKQTGCHSYDEVFGAGDTKHYKEMRSLERKLQMDQPINIQFTSGTTGSPKGATLTHHNLLNNSFFTGLRCGYHENKTRICVPVPFYHCFGMALGNLKMLTHNATCIYPSPSFDPLTTLVAVEKEKATSLYGTPTMFIDELNHPKFEDFDLSSLDTGIIAGSPCPEEIMKKMVKEMNMKHVTKVYGTTENSPVTFQGFREDSLEKRTASIGKPHDHVEVKIVNKNDELVKQGETGEVCTRGYTTMLGYWNDEIQTKAAITADRWYHTGDIGYLDEHGYGHISGRLKDMVIRGGENIYPVEVENFIYKHEKVADVQVVGLEDGRMGEELVAFIKIRNQQKLTDEDIRNFCKGNLAHFKIPKFIHFVEEYPLTITGKVQKFKLRQQAKSLFSK